EITSAGAPPAAASHVSVAAPLVAVPPAAPPAMPGGFEPIVRPMPLPADPFVAPTASSAPAGGDAWEEGLEADALALLAEGHNDVWDQLSRRFESRLILTALSSTRGRRIEAAQRLGIGRNTI